MKNNKFRGTVILALALTLTSCSSPGTAFGPPITLEYQIDFGKVQLSITPDANARGCIVSGKYINTTNTPRNLFANVIAINKGTKNTFAQSTIIFPSTLAGGTSHGRANIYASLMRCPAYDYMLSATSSAL